jgi:hypothetical protein
MGGFDRDGDGVADMYIDATAQAVGGIRGHIGTLEAALAGAFAEIDTCYGKLGNGGQLSDQFTADYAKWRDGAGSEEDPGLAKAVRDLPGKYRLVADNGDAAVGAYRSAEEESVGRFRS